MSSFENNTRLSNDENLADNVQNRMIHEYLMTSYNTLPDDIFHDFVANNRNLQFTDGKGIGPEFIDADSEIKNNQELTHDKRKKQMSVRTFLASPNLGRGESVPILEHVLISGENTSACGNVREAMYYKYPMSLRTSKMIEDNNNALNVWDYPIIGENSKDVFKRMKNGQF